MSEKTRQKVNTGVENLLSRNRFSSNGAETGNLPAKTFPCVMEKLTNLPCIYSA